MRSCCNDIDGLPWLLVPYSHSPWFSASLLSRSTQWRARPQNRSARSRNRRKDLRFALRLAAQLIRLVSTRSLLDLD